MGLATARVRAEGAKVLLEVDGRLIFNADWRDALAIVDAIRAQAKRAEEFASADQIIFDQALVIRRGLPFGLTRRRDLLREAVKEAGWNRTLRRAMPGGIRSTNVVGTPTLIGHPPNGGTPDAHD